MNFGNFFNKGSTWLFIMLSLFVVVILFLRFKSTETGIRKIDAWKMKAPAVGKVVKLNLFAQFARTLATLLHNGVPVLTALKITEQVIPNRILKDAIAKTRADVTDGKTLAQPLARSKIFPQLMIDLVKIGEETGDVPGALENVASTYESELNIALRVMTNLIEPAMIIVMAILRGSPAELVIRAEGGQLNVVPAREDSAEQTAASVEALGQPAEPSADKAASQSPVFSARLNENVAVTLLYVNLKDQMEAEETRVHFYPNGTSDEFTMIVQAGNGMRKISLECVTALATVEVIQ